jgi:hypothetical protein
MALFAKLDCPIWLQLGTGPCLSSNFCLLALGLVLCHCNILWIFVHALRRIIIGQSFTPQPYLVLTAP